MITLRKSLLACGMLASALYVGVDLLAAIRYPEYHSFTSQLISELMATRAPTERLVDPFYLLYDALMMAFAVGVWLGDPRRRARITGALLFAYAAIGLLGPTVFEMNVRGAGGDPTADRLHIAITMVLVLFIVAAVAFGASLAGRWFRLYSFATLFIMAALGVLMSLMAPEIGSDEPTPSLGLVERISIAAFLLWVVVLATALWRAGAPAIISTSRGGSRLANASRRGVVMQMNEGKWDRVARVILGLALIAVAFVGPKTPLGLLGVIPLLTGLTGFCPLYRLLGINTCRTA